MGRAKQEVFNKRFWQQVSVGGSDDCWLWTGQVSWNGYGIRYWLKRFEVAHRIAYKLSGGVIPEGQLLRHKCDVRLCCNPDHLEPGTHADNMRDMAVRGRAARVHGEANPHSKLTTDQVTMVIAMRLAGRSCRDVGRVFGVSNQQVSKISRGIWRANG